MLNLNSDGITSPYDSNQVNPWANPMPVQGSAALQAWHQAAFELIRLAALPLPQADPNRVGAGLPELERLPSMLNAGMPYGYLGEPAAAIRQLRAAGLWV